MISAARRFPRRGARARLPVFRVRDIAGEDQVLLDDPVAGRERVPEVDVSGSTSRGCGCWPALSVRQAHHRSRKAWRVRRFVRQPVLVSEEHGAEYVQLRQ